MAALLGVDVDRTISLDLRHRRGARGGRGHDGDAVLRRDRFLHRLPRRGEGVHRGGARRHRLVAGRDARRPPDRPHRGVLVGLFLLEYKDVAVFAILVLVLIFRPTGLLGRARGGEGLMAISAALREGCRRSRALVALILAIRWSACPTNRSGRGASISRFDLGGDRGRVAVRRPFRARLVAAAGVEPSARRSSRCFLTKHQRRARLDRRSASHRWPFLPFSRAIRSISRRRC